MQTMEVACKAGRQQGQPIGTNVLKFALHQTEMLLSCVQSWVVMHMGYFTLRGPCADMGL